MKTASRTFIAVAALLAAAAASAAGIDGKWVGKVGESDITFVFKSEGEKLTGTLDNAAQAGVIEIKDGKIKGDEVSFHVVRALQNAETKIEWKGKVTGDELKLQRGAVGGNAAADVTAKRVKETK